MMRDNVSKVMEREGKLSDLDTRAANLEQSAVNFTTSSKRLRKKYLVHLKTFYTIRKDCPQLIRKVFGIVWLLVIYL